MLLHSLGKDITEDSIKKIITAAGAKPDDVRIKALVAALQKVDIDEAIKKGTTIPTAAPAPAAEEAKPKEEEKKEEEKEEKGAAEGLGQLFG
jgi:large subunit ribosomal protein L12